VNFSSIHSKSSVKPLQISRDALEKLKNIYGNDSELWDSASAFGNKPLSAAAGEGGTTIQDRDNGIQGTVLTKPSFLQA
jgi:hypothetical protein